MEEGRWLGHSDLSANLTCQLDSIRCKHNVRWQHLSRMKNVANVSIQNFFLANATGYEPGQVTWSKTD